LSSIHDHQLEAILHRGSSSEIWRATRLGPNGFGVPVALKTLNETCAAVPDQVRSFLKEARAASAVQHHNVAQIRELILDSNRYWLSMDLVVGWPMRTLLAELDDAGQRIPIPVALSLARDAVRGVMAIHDMGLVHRNVSPDNLMVAAAGHVVVLDFGLATWQHAQRIQFTPPIDVLDPEFSSPELRARLPADARADVFSLGALLDRLIPERSDAPIALDAIIRRAIDADPTRRFPSAQSLEIALDLMSIREGWLVPPSYVTAYLNDVFRTAAPGPAPRAAGSNADPADLSPTAAIDDRGLPPRGSIERGTATGANRAVLPRGRHGMVGVGATLPTPDNVAADWSVTTVRLRR
jgi:serine/threonine protein kinase